MCFWTKSLKSTFLYSWEMSQDLRMQINTHIPNVGGILEGLEGRGQPRDKERADVKCFNRSHTGESIWGPQRAPSSWRGQCPVLCNHKGVKAWARPYRLKRNQPDAALCSACNEYSSHPLRTNWDIYCLFILSFLGSYLLFFIIISFFILESEIQKREGGRESKLLRIGSLSRCLTKLDLG